MAATYGAEEGRLSVGIDVVMSPATVTAATSSVTLTWYSYARATYAFNDAQVMTLSNTLSASKNYTMKSENYETTTLLVGTWSQTISTSYSGTVTRTLVSAASGLFNGGTPSHSRSIVIPKRPPQVPDAPTSASVVLATTSSAKIDWTRPANASSSSDIWTNAIVQRSTNGGAYSTIATLAGTATTHTDSGLLTNTTYTYRVYSSNVTGNSANVSAGSVATTMPTPTAVTPAASSTVTKPNPTLGATVTAVAGGVLTKIQWQFATDSGFTTNLRTVTESDTDLRTSGATTETPTPQLLSLTNGVWYIRARQVTADDTYGPYSTGQSFTVNTPAVPAPTAVTPAAAASVTTMQPTLGATITVDTAARSMKAEWQLATNSGFTTGVRTITESDTDFRASGATTEITPLDQRISMAEATTWYVRARAVGNDGSVSTWTTGTSFTLSVTAPPAPTNIIPATGGAVVGSNTPVLGATVVAATENRTSRVEWQLATDSGFTANLRTVLEGSGDLRTSGATTELTPQASKLFQATWFVRARQQDEFNQYGAYSASQTFTVAHIPAAIQVKPSADEKVLYNAGGTEFSWIFTDPSSGDTQTAYQIIVERNDTGAAVIDTGKVTSSASTGTHVITSGFKDIVLRWKIRLWDNDNVAGNYSGYNVFTLSDVPTVTITAPTNDQVLSTGQPTFTWTNDATTVQVSRRVVVTRVSDGVTVHDSGTTNTTSLSYTPTTAILENTVSYTASITVTDSYGMSGTGVRNFSTAYSSPDPVALTVDESGYDESGYVYIDWSQTTPDGFFVDWRVYRRPVESTSWELIYLTNDASVVFHNDWKATSGTTYEYAVTQTAGRFGAVLESPIALTESRVVESSHYWLISPYNEADNLRLSNVTDDGYSDEYEEQDFIIIGRGRKVNMGTRIGYTGSLTAQLRDDVLGTARSKRMKLQLLKAARTSYYLRNPFGDLLLVSLGNLQMSRIAGVGTAEFVDVTIPYKEVS